MADQSKAEMLKKARKRGGPVGRIPGDIRRVPTPAPEDTLPDDPNWQPFGYSDTQPVDPYYGVRRSLNVQGPQYNPLFAKTPVQLDNPQFFPQAPAIYRGMQPGDIVGSQPGMPTVQGMPNPPKASGIIEPLGASIVDILKSLFGR